MLTETQTILPTSYMAENLIGSEIIKLAAEVNEKIKAGEKIYNLTIGDFNPQIFPIPAEFRDAIINAYKNNITNYPAANGELELRKQVAAFIKDRQGLDYKPEEYLISGGGRPLIYALYRTLLDDGDKVIFPIPSWNNNHYCHLTSAQQILVDTLPENNFMPTADDIRNHINDATLVALCSPLNPTGTVFSKDELTSICKMIVDENKRRNGNQKPLYLLYDQIYWTLTFGNTKHYDPVNLNAEIRPYTVYVDGMSKAFAATGIRIGWAMGPLHVIDKMKSILSHVGSWAPKAEQVAAAEFLKNKTAIDAYLLNFKNEISKRLTAFYNGFVKMEKEGYSVKAIAPQAALYLTVQFNLIGKKTTDGKTINNSNDITYFLVNHAKTALVPFSAFGAEDSSTWFRLSVGTAQMDEIEIILSQLKQALRSLS